MKKGLFMLPLLGGLIVAGCSSDDTIAGVDTLPESYTNSYLSVSVIGANAAGTRAEYQQGDGEYEDGTETENHINKVRFFFFDEKGDAAEVKKETTGDYVSYIDVMNNESNEYNQNETVEKIIETTLRLNIPDGHDNPKKVLAVINPTSDIEGLGNASLDELKKQVRDFKTYNETVELTNNNFVMSNSVYSNETSGEVFGAETLEDRNFQTTDDAAKANPVKIYVERVLARLDFSLALSESKDGNPSKMLEDGTIIYKLKTPEGNDGEQYKINDGDNSNDEDLYVKFINWDITGTPVKSRLIKEINANWKTPDLFGVASELLWTTTDYHRSFWALNPDLGEKPNDATSNTNYKFVSFEEASLDMPNPPSIVSTYLQENANAYSSDMTAAAPDYATKVIITAQLVDENGKPKTLAKWLNNYYTLDGVKIAMANLLEDLYMKDGDGGYKHVSSGDLTLGQATIEGAKSYYAQATVDDKKAWYEKDGDTYTLIEDVNNKYIYTKLGYALVWETGYTYYFFDIHHLGNPGSLAYNGIVRNHIYKTSITSVAGLGTPVYKPEEKIYPEIPGKESIISAKVNILSWRVVSSSYDLTW